MKECFVGILDNVAGKKPFCPTCYFYSKTQKWCYFFMLDRDRLPDTLVNFRAIDKEQGTFYTEALIDYLKKIGIESNGF